MISPMICALDLAYHVGTQNNYESVPAPSKETTNALWLYDYAAFHMQEWAEAGITDIVSPPPGKAQGGSGKGCDGYGAFNPFYDLGLTEDQGSTETRFGSFSSLLRMVARAHRFGMRVHFSVVLHQRDGGIGNGIYQFSPNKQGRWPLNAECFMGNPPRRPRDPIMGDVADDFSFGDPCVYVNATPKNYMIQGAVDAVDWMTTTLDADGYWIDDPKGLAQETVSRVVNEKSMKTRWAFCEYYDGNPNTLNWFVWNQMNGRVSTMDFTLRWKVQAAANNASRYDMRQILNGGFNLQSENNAVTFVEDHDTDLSFPCIWNKAMAYFILMMMPGLPMPFGRDYFVRENCYGLAPILNNQIWCRVFLAQGEFVPRYGSYQIIAWERMGFENAPGCLCAVNNQMGSKSNPADWVPITVQTHWNNCHLHDYSNIGANDVWTNAEGMVTVWVPPNENGLGYVCYAPEGVSQAIPKWAPRTTTHRLEAAVDLGIPIAKANSATIITDLWCEANEYVTIKQLHGNTGLRFVMGSGKQEAILPAKFLMGTCGKYPLMVLNQTTVDQGYVIEVTYMGGSELSAADVEPESFSTNRATGVNDLGRKQVRVNKLAATQTDRSGLPKLEREKT